MKRITRILCVLLTILFIFTGCSFSDNKEQEVAISSEVQQMAEEISEAVENGEEIGTEEIPEDITAPKEDIIENEDAIENDAAVEQEDISYDGVNTGNGLSLLGACTGKTYYSQFDSRWASIMYSNHNDKKQTMSSSGCGPTSAAMIVSSSKGAITPPVMAKIFVDNGYRTYSNGTAWSAWSFVADYFGFKEYHTTSNFNTMLTYLKKGYYVVASCNSGLFTSSGHYIVLVGDSNKKIQVYDPYLYSGKFNTASRRAAGAVINGVTVTVSESSFYKYSNAVQYWIYSNDYIPQPKNTTKPKTTKPKTTKPKTTKSNTKIKYVNTTSAELNVRYSPSSNAKIVKTLKRGTKVTVYKTSGKWSNIGTNQWVSSSYLSTTNPIKKTINTAITYKTKVGNTYRLKATSTLYSKGNLTGTKYEYYRLSEFKILKHYSSTVDYVQSTKTGRKAYIKVNNFKL